MQGRLLKTGTLLGREVPWAHPLGVAPEPKKVSQKRCEGQKIKPILFQDLAKSTSVLKTSYGAQPQIHKIDLISSQEPTERGRSLES